MLESVSPRLKRRGLKKRRFLIPALCDIKGLILRTLVRSYRPFNVFHELQKKEVYPHEIEKVKVITTAISKVFLTGKYAYKLCKPVDFGFLDFSTLEQRKKACEDEVSFNRIISPDLYLGVSTINKDGEGNISIDGPGEIIEYAVKMKQLDPALIMSELLKENKITPEHTKELAVKIYQFHQRALTDEETSSFGSVEMVQFNWDENFKQTERYKNIVIPENNFSFMQQKINSFIAKNKELLAKRVVEGKVKHCHGDFHSGNVFITPTEIYIFDGIVFNKRFPCSDVIAEIAFMAMDLDFHGKKELAEVFVKEYQRLSRDEDILKLLDFYKCYRAYIRGKINCFTSEDLNLTAAEKEKTINDAKKYFELANNYAGLL